jgi:beta-lactamase superfamily II metal-dependent hydrolase
MRCVLVAAVLLCVCATGVGARDTLDIYFIDVEGGQATLIVTPAGQSLLIDAGYPGRNGRDPDRIMAAVRDAHLARIDFLIITHFHEDHDGGVAELARRIPIGTFVDGDAPIQTAQDVVEAFAAYAEARKSGKHVVPKPGDRLPLKGLEVDVVSAGGSTLTKPLDGAGQPNAACADFVPRGDGRTENPRSIGVRIRFGAFRFLDLGDLDWNKLGELVCPNNLIGEAEAYLVAHHGNGDSNVPAVLAAVQPRAAVVNNGPWKGGTSGALSTLHSYLGLEHVWQLHRNGNEGADNSDDTFIANLEEDERDTAAWLKLAATDDGRFSVTNGRTGIRKDYGATTTH